MKRSEIALLVITTIILIFTILIWSEVHESTEKMTANGRETLPPNLEKILDIGELTNDKK